ncbi:MAG TPA: hypothetical protein DCL44_01230 [Elusimicrobia bacterium]|nr:hypothetical protein [Elusimicrobiota bacterium]
MGKTADKDTLGIYISPSEICLSEVKVGKNSRLEVQHLVTIPTGFTSKSGMTRPLSINSDFFNEKAAWLAGFNQAIKKVNWGSSSVVVTFSPQFAILRYFVMPVMDRKFWGRSILIESKKYIPVAFEEIIYDYNAVTISGGKKLGVLFAITQRKSVEFLINELKNAGLQLASLEVSSCSMERLFAFLDPKDHASKAYIHFSASQSLTLFSNDGYPVLYRENDFDNSSSLSERKRLDVKGAVQFVERYVGGQAYRNLMLSGENLETWTAMAAQESPMPPLTWEPAKLADLKNNSPASLFSVGASIKGSSPGKLTLDLSGISTAAKLEKQVQSYVWNITILLSSIMLLVSLISQTRLFILDSKLATMKAKVVNVPELDGRSVESIKSTISDIQGNRRTLFSLLSNSDTIAPKMQVIVDNIPAEIWIAELTYTNPFNLDNMQSIPTEMLVRGKTALTGDMKFRAVDFFVKSLKTSSEFKVFTPPNGGVEFDLGLDNQFPSGGRTDGEFTAFSITCSVKRRL